MRKYRKKEQLFIAEGVRSVEQILRNGYIQVREVFAADSLAETFTFIPENLPLYTTDAGTLAGLADTENSQGILAVCEIPEEKSPDKMAAGLGLIVGLDAVQDPGNAGTIIRTAAWFGAAGILSGNGTVDIYHPKVVRSTAGATGSLPVLNGDLNELLSFFHHAGWSVSLLDGGADSTDIRSVPRNDRRIIVIGNEGNGIQNKILNSGYTAIKIPGWGDAVESLNAAIACGISLFHLSTDDKHEI